MVPALDILRAASDATRLRVLCLLRSMELSVGELAQVLEQSQPRVSRHVKILCDAGLAVRRKEGSWVFVALGDAALVTPLLDALDAWSMADEAQLRADGLRLSEVRADRAAAAAAWFEAHAGDWDAIRSLHVAEEQVEAAMVAALGSARIDLLVDIGTGTGRMLELFAPQATQAIGIDRSSEMLRLARAKLTERGLDHAELRQADILALPVDTAVVGAAVLHHVLHFVQHPGAAIAEAARVLRHGGRLLICDFAPHEREDLRVRDAHARLGFSDEQMQGWFAEAGLVPVSIETLGGGELTVKLWMARRAYDVQEVKAA
ncbi:ArsR/SmtB family transcription factor [Sphingomonas hankookensis]|uniref:ArsR family transcriptional regulator n=1 Tax=Sphingomonas hengshuiensis TaxID=1609977 RepID=A0A2W5B4E2_9SPHN|nr:MAG: ArsR family transcriptional regulator [Sphingomonas hengshuiensis]